MPTKAEWRKAATVKKCHGRSRRGVYKKRRQRRMTGIRVYRKRRSTKYFLKKGFSGPVMGKRGRATGGGGGNTIADNPSWSNLKSLDEGYRPLTPFRPPGAWNPVMGQPISITV